MPFTQSQLDAASAAVLNANVKSKPIDQINKERPFLEILVAKKKVRVGGLQYFTEPVRTTNDSNYQNYFGDDQVSYNKKNTAVRTQFPWYDSHDGFSINEDEAAQYGIILTDEREAVSSQAEQVQLFNLLDEKYDTLKTGYQENLDLEFHRDGTQNAKAVPGLDSLISTTPTTGIIGGINAATSTYWRNNADLAISTATAGNILAEMEKMYRANMTYGGLAPDTIFCGSAFLDAYAKDARSVNSYQVTTPSKGGVNLDGGRSGVYFKGVELVWDPTFDALDGILGAITYPWTKRCYMLNSKTITLRPIDGHWMQMRNPPRVYDRYTYYRALTSKYSLTTNQRNANAVLSIA